jgi:hypothetical protein
LPAFGAVFNNAIPSQTGWDGSAEVVCGDDRRHASIRWLCLLFPQAPPRSGTHRHVIIDLIGMEKNKACGSFEAHLLHLEAGARRVLVVGGERRRKKELPQSTPQES